MHKTLLYNVMQWCSTDPGGVTVDLVMAPESGILLCDVVRRLLCEDWLHQLSNMDVLPDELHGNNLFPFK